MEFVAIGGFFADLKFLSILLLVLHSLLPLRLHPIVLLSVCAGRVGPPVFEADPAELVFAAASHVVAAFVLFDGVLAGGADFVAHDFDPLVLVVEDHLVPVLNFGAVDGEMVVSAAETADRPVATTPDRLQILVVHNERRPASGVRAHLHCIIFPRVLQDKLVHVGFLQRRVALIVEDHLDEQVTHI